MLNLDNAGFEFLERLDTMDDIKELRKFGKWSQDGVPHKEWVCVGTDEDENASTLCEMCEHQHIRYIHIMEHPRYPDRLKVGQVCAGNMEGDLFASEYRDKAMRHLSARRSNFPKLKGWKASKAGNVYIKTSEEAIVTVIVGKNGMFLYSVKYSGTVSYSKMTYNNVESAARAAFDTMIQMTA